MHWLFVYTRPNRITNDLPVAGAILAVALCGRRRPLRAPPAISQNTTAQKYRG